MPFLKDLFYELPDDVFNPERDWLEVIGGDQPGGGETFSLQSGDAVVMVELDWTKARSFLRYCLGFSYADEASPWRLHRENPAYHPRFPWLSASTVTFSSKAQKANPTQTGTYIDGIFSDSLRVAAYQKIYATVRFTDRPWMFLEDSQILPLGIPETSSYLYEPLRNTYYTPTPSVEIISATGLNNIKWANNPDFPNPPGTAIPAPFGTLMSKCTISLRWMWVPHEYISGSDPSTFTPLWINSVVGRVNNDTFLGYPAGTLLLQAPQYERFRFPLATQGGIEGFFGWNITFPLQFFDPDRAYEVGTLTTRTDDSSGVITITNPAATTFVNNDTIDITWDTGSQVAVISGVAGNVITFGFGSGDALPAGGTDLRVYNHAYRGHQLVPYRKNLKWYGATREDNIAKLYPETDFYDLFRHVGTF